MSKGTILYIGGFELPDKNAAAHRVINNAKILRDLGYEVIFIGVDKSLLLSSEVYKKDVQGFTSWFQAYPKNSLEWIDYLCSIAEFKKTYDKYPSVKAVICYNYPALALMKIHSFCAKRNTKVISDCTEWYDHKGNGIVFGLIKGLDTFYRMRILHKKLDGLIVISNYLEKYYNQHPNIINLPPLVDLDEDKWQISAGKPNDTTTLVYAGSPGRKDKINLLILALETVKKSFHLNVIGISLEKFLNEYPECENSLRAISDKVCFLGRLGHLETLEYVKRADFSCFFRENHRTNEAGFPTKFVESISCGTPVITNNTSNIRDFANNKNAICLECLNISEISKMINTVIDKFDFERFNNNVFNYKNYIESMNAFMEKVLKSL